MAYDEALARRVRACLESEADASEKKMFGGLCFLAGGNMCCGIVEDELMVRTGPQGYEEALAQPHARPMEFTGRPMRGFVTVGREGFAADWMLAAWVRRGLAGARLDPPKKASKTSARANPA